MKRLAAAVAAWLIIGIPGITQAATLRPLDKDGLNLRSGPGTGYKVLGGLAPDQAAAVIGEESGWFKVRTGDGLEAWVSGAFSRISYEGEQAYAVVNTDVLNVRKQPGLDAPVLTQVRQDDRVRLLERLGDWWRVRLEGGAEGWVAAPYMKRAAAPAPTPAPLPVPPPAKAPPSTPPTTPPVPPPVPKPQPAPQAPPIQPAPASVVPVLTAVAPPLPLPLGNKQVSARSAAGVYEGRDTDVFNRVDSIKPGETLTYLGAAEGWVKVQTARGNAGWVPGTNVQVSEGRLAYAVGGDRWALAYGAAQPAPAPAPGAELLAGTKVERRAVRDADGLRLRESASLDAAVVDVLPQGDILEIQESKAPWLKVKSSQGKAGWVHGDYTIVMPPKVIAPAPAPVPAPVPQPASREALQATLQVTAPGVLRLEVTAKELALGQAAVNGTALVIPVPNAQAQAATLPVGTAGVRFLSLNATGLVLSLERAPGWKVLEQGTGKVVVEVRSTVTGITVQEASDRTVYAVQVSGPAVPVAKGVGATVTVDFPGSNLNLAAAAPAGVKVEQTASGVRMTLSSRRAYALRRTEQGFELHLYKPGLAGKTIVLDPGHGGDDSGAYNRTTGVKEKEINLQDALRLRAYLVAKGANVLMTRSTDTRSATPEVIRLGGDDLTHIDLGYRSRMANELKADLFMSIHHNAGDSAGGTETFYTGWTLNGGRSSDLARLMQKSMTGPLGQRDRGAIDDLMYVTRMTDSPAILLEVAFLDHRIEQNLVKDPVFQDRAVRQMLQALEQFYAERAG